MVFAGSTCYMSYRADHDDAMGHTRDGSTCITCIISGESGDIDDTRK